MMRISMLCCKCSDAVVGRSIYLRADSMTLFACVMRCVVVVAAQMANRDSEENALIAILRSVKRPFDTASRTLGTRWSCFAFARQRSSAGFPASSAEKLHPQTAEYEHYLAA